MSRTDEINRLNRTIGPLILQLTPVFIEPNGESYSKRRVNTQDTVSITYSYVLQGTLNRQGTTTPFFNSPVKRPDPLPINAFTHSFKVDYPIQVYEKSLLRYRNDFSAIRTVSGYQGYSQLGIAPEPPANEMLALHNYLKSALLLKVKGQKINLAQAMAERKQTADLVLSSLASLAKAYSKVRKGDLLGAAKSLGVPPPRKWLGNAKGYANSSAVSKTSRARNASQRWLELQYGWRPLLGDIFGAVEAYHKVRQRKAIQVVTKKGGRENETFVYDNKYSPENPTYLTSRCTIEVKYVCAFSLSNDVNKSLSELGITNPLLIAWELTPWSFVADWFLPIGNYISQLDATLGATFEYGSVTTHTTSSIEKLTAYLPSSSYIFRFGYKTERTSYVSTVRSKMGGFPRPVFPDFKDPFSKLHFANAVALFVTNVRRK